jgi:hypothetical protein
MFPDSEGKTSELHEKRRLVKYITQNLEAAYGVPVNDSPYDPLSELILTILSQSTTDVNSRRAFENLKRRFPDWESARRARASSIAAAIKSGGLANAKSVVIKSALNEIKKRRGSLDLSFLHTSPIEEAREFLTSLAGVGPKTAACVLLFACKKKYFRWTYIFSELQSGSGWFLRGSAMNNRTKEWRNWFRRRSITRFTSTLSGMAGKFAVRKIRNAIIALWSSSVITANLNFDSDQMRGN